MTAQPFLLYDPSARRRMYHMWDGKDTLCQLYSTGSWNKEKYVIINDEGQAPVCRNCTAVAKILPRRVW